MTGIRQVSRGDYDVRHAYAGQRFQELVWYATDDDQVLGVLVLDKPNKTAKTYSWVVMAEEEDQPGFVGVDLAHSIKDEDEAAAQLQQAMRNQAEILRIRSRI
jgi:hypothetical protein